MQEKRTKGSILASVIELSKIRITISVTLSTLAGYILFAGSVDNVAIWASLGVFLLASSSAALNQFQERKTDALMLRTSKRPMPSGRIRVGEALLVVILLFAGGTAILYLKTNMISLGLGILSLLWYNLIYTPLKYRTVFALIIGSVIGALPPLIGWTAAGGELMALPPLFLAFFIYIWQVPHFILLLFLYGDDYKKAGLPVLTTFYSEMQVRRITFVWVLGTMISGLMLPFMCQMQYVSSTVLVISLSLLMMLSMVGLIREKATLKVKRIFILINIYLLLVLLILIFDQLVQA